MSEISKQGLTTKEEKQLGLYLALAFGLAWACQIGGSFALFAGQGMVYTVLLIVCMFCPLVAVLITRRLVAKEPTGILWKPHFKGKIRWWLAALLLPFVLTVLGGALYFLVFPSHFDGTGAYIRAQMGEAAMQQLEAAGLTPITYGLISAVQAATLAPFINMIPAMGEEVGWRGMFYPLLKKKLGKQKGRVVGGIIWGVWHWPIMLLTGYEYGLRYLGAPVAGLVIFCLFATVLGILLDVAHEKTECIFAPALAHGAVNACAGLSTMFWKPEMAQFSIFGPMPIGLVAMLPSLLLALLVLRKEK